MQRTGKRYYICRIGFKFCSSRIGMARMDTVDLSSGDEVYTPDVEEVEDDLFPPRFLFMFM